MVALETLRGPAGPRPRHVASGLLATLRHAIAARMKDAIWGAADLVGHGAGRLPEPLADPLRATVLVAVQAGASALGLWRGPRRWVNELSPTLSPPRAWALAAAIERHHYLAKAVLRQSQIAGEGWLVRVVDVRGRATLDALQAERRPVVVVAWHAGLVAALPAALAQCGRTGLFLRLGDPTPPRHGFAMTATGTAPNLRARSLIQAVSALKKGETVVVVTGIGTRDTPHVMAQLLGRAVCVAPGAAVMARLAGAAIVPVECRFRRGRITIEVFDPLPRGVDDEETTRRLAAFFAARLVADPSALWRNELGRLVEAALIAPDTVGPDPVGSGRR